MDPVSATWNIDDRSTGRKSTLNLVGEVGHNGKHWNVFAAAVGVAGGYAIGTGLDGSGRRALDVQTPLIPQTLLNAPLGPTASPQ